MLAPSVELVDNKLHRSCPPRTFSSKALHSDPVPYATHFPAQSAALSTAESFPLVSTNAAAPFTRTLPRAPLKWSSASVGQGASVVVVVVVVVVPPPSHCRLKLPVPFTLPPASLQADVAMHWPSKSACLFLHFEQASPWHVWQLEGHVHGCGDDPSVVLPLQTGCLLSSPSSSSDSSATTHFRLKLPAPCTVPLIVLPSQTSPSIQLPANRDSLFLQTLHWPLITSSCDPTLHVWQLAAHWQSAPKSVFFPEHGIESRVVAVVGSSVVVTSTAPPPQTQHASLADTPSASASSSKVYPPAGASSSLWMAAISLANAAVASPSMVQSRSGSSPKLLKPSS